jgi:RNA polymerase sporulation-specific sigma factor
MNEEGETLFDMISAGGAYDPERLVIDQESEQAFWDQIKKQLSSLESVVLDEYLSGLNYRQIAEKLGKSPKTIDNALSRIKCKITTKKHFY